MTAERTLDQTSERVGQLLDELAGADPEVSERTGEAIRLLMELYGAALERIVEHAGPAPASGGETGDAPPLERMLDDELVSALLILHDLHPLDATTRIQRALDRIRPYLGSHSGDVELVSVDPEHSTVLLRLQGNCDGCPSSTMTVKGSIERVIAEAAPEIEEVRVEGVAEPAPEPSVSEPGFVPLDSLRHRPPEHAMACTVPEELGRPGPAGGERGEGTT